MLPVVPFEELKGRLGEVWSSAPWERVAPMLAPVHEQLVRLLEPRAGLRWLDVATGTGSVARLAARQGAEVVGVDLAPGLVATARRLAAEEDLEIVFEVGDAEALPVEEASFDVVSSSMGVIFAPDHAAVADELARVTKPGGRVGFTAWREGACFQQVTRKYAPSLEPAQGDSLDWAREEYAQRLLGDAFELEFAEGDAPMIGRSGEAIFQLLVESAGPMKARAETMPPELFQQFHTDFVNLFEQHRHGNTVSVPGPYLTILGQRH